MSKLTDIEWESINKIILDIYSHDNSQKMRKVFLENIRVLITYDLAEFSLGNNDMQLYDSVEINMVSGEKINIMERYLDLKKLHGNEKQDWFFRYPYSYVITNATRQLPPGIYENSKFNTIFLKSINMDYCCTATLRNEDSFFGELSLYATESDFSDKDVYILNQLKDHLSKKLSDLLKKNHPAKISGDQLDYLIKLKLTEREIQVFQLLLTDMPNYSIANELCISPNTVKKHVGNIFDKLDVRTRAQLKNKIY